MPHGFEKTGNLTIELVIFLDLRDNILIIFIQNYGKKFRNYQKSMIILKI
jgi:hypothetical protein